MVNVVTWIDTMLPKLPFPHFPYPWDYDYHYGYHSVQQSRVTCSVEFNKIGIPILTVISKKHCKYTPGLIWDHPEECNFPGDEISVMYQLDFANMHWSKRTTNIQYFGSLAILNGIKYFINISNEERVLGYVHHQKNDTWIQLNRPQLDFEAKLQSCKQIGCKTMEPVVIVPYLEALLK